MNDPRRSEPISLPLTGSGSSGSQGYQAPPLTDPAYADQTPYATTYGGQFSQWATRPAEAHSTRPLPRSWQHEPAGPDEMSRQGFAPPPPEGPKSPRWLVLAAVVSVLLVVGLIVALIIVNGGSKTQTAVEPLPPMPAPSSPTLATPRTHLPSAAPLPPTISGPPTESTEPGVLQPVVYSVTGEGRVISITYMDTGDVIQTEFNVALPWTKEVSLSKSPTRPASVTILNFGHNVTCSVTVAGVQVREREGVGLTICDAANR